VTEDVIRQNREDIEWAEERLGHSMSESLTLNPEAVSDPDLFIKVAMEQADTIVGKLGLSYNKPIQTPTELAQALASLR